jgi:hypothetical protein
MFGIDLGFLHEQWQEEKRRNSHEQLKGISKRKINLKRRQKHKRKRR